MRSLLPTLFALLLAACPQGSLNDEAVGDDGMVPDPNNPAKAFCIDDGDCQLASSTCCECPSFALGMADPKLDACNGVMCPPKMGECAKVSAVCVKNLCAVACDPVEVTRTCQDGFATDVAGCLIDACAAAAAPECTTNGQCVRTRADCCGCARGGNDTAVVGASRGFYDQSLGCTGDEICPEVSTCVAEETPQCAQGACKLIAGALPADACGRPDLAACAAGTVCTVNANDPADKHGVGVCR